jgi:hypothetical protein
MKRFSGELLVQDAARGGHPLDVARTGHTTLAGGIPVLDLAFVDNGHGLEAAMRVGPDTARAHGGTDLAQPDRRDART